MINKFILFHENHYFIEFLRAKSMKNQSIEKKPKKFENMKVMIGKRIKFLWRKYMAFMTYI